MPTVDAFRVRKIRKKNIWETKYTEKDLHEKFRSILLKSPPVTEAEQFDLDRGWAVYRSVLRMTRLLSICAGDLGLSHLGA